jgi:Asp-tRNA(Asn)/Glu-tRNA(Gln) amidotransferase A subunit family amidase
MSLPSGFSKEKLPIGIQFCADNLQEQNLLNYGLWYERNFPVEKITTAI